MCVSTVVVQSTKAVASTPTMVKPNFSNIIYEGVGSRNSNTDGSTYRQDDSEPAALTDNYFRDMTQKHRSVVLQALLQRYAEDRMGRGLFQEITGQFN